MTRVFVKASSPAARAGIEKLFRGNSAFRLVEESSGDATWAGGESPADVLLVEAATLADPNARQATEWAGAGGTVVLLVRNPAAESLSQAVRAGVKAVLPSGADGEEILAAVAAAAAGLVVFDTTGVETLIRGPGVAANDSSDGPVETLTPREREVLQLLAAGLGNKEIASRLEISEHTVKFHVASIMGKLGATSRTEAVTLGIRHGLIMI
jgi:two-component system, NarL family, response regulator YdfI